MRCRINYQDLVDELKRLKEGAPFPDEVHFPKWQIEPRPEWHNRECIKLAPGVFRFPEERSPKHHLIAEWRLTEIESADAPVVAA